MSETTTTMNAIVDDLTNRFKGGAPDRPRADLMFVIVPQAEAVAAVTHMKAFWDFKHLVYYTAVDVIERGLFRVCYMLHSYSHKVDVCIQTEISRDAPVMESIHYLWAGAATYERELKEMFGIDFPGCPRVDEPFALEGWDNIPPMRRDFDTRAYSEETYYARPGRQKHDRVEIMKKALYPEVDV